MSASKDGSIQFPAGFRGGWIFRSTVSQNSVASLDWTPNLFSKGSVVLDSNQFQSASSAKILQQSEEAYDWDKLRAMALENKQM